MSRIKREQFDNKLRALQDDINSLSKKLSISPKKSRANIESTINKPNQVKISEVITNRIKIIDNISQLKSQDRFIVEDSSHLTSNLKRRQDYIHNNELQIIILQRDEAIKNFEIIKGENLLLLNSVEELKSLQELYEHLKRDYDSLKLSMESSERIRRQQKELIYMLQQSAVLKHDFAHESALVAPTLSNIKPTTVFHDLNHYESDRKEKIANRADNLAATNTATILGDSSRHKIINDINDTLPIDFNKTIRINSEHHPTQPIHATADSNNISLPDNGYLSHRLYDHRDNINNCTRIDHTTSSPQTMQEMYKNIRNTYVSDNQGNYEKDNVDQDVDEASSTFLDRQQRYGKTYNKNRRKDDPFSTILSNVKANTDIQNNIEYYQEEYPKTSRSEVSSTSTRDKSLLFSRRAKDNDSDTVTQKTNSHRSNSTTTLSSNIAVPRNSPAIRKHAPNPQTSTSSRRRSTSTSRPRSAPASRSNHSPPRRTPSRHYMNPIASTATSHAKATANQSLGYA